MTRAADLAVIRQQSSGASLCSRMSCLDLRVCCQRCHVGLQLQLAQPFAIRQSGAPKGRRCCCLGSAVGAVVLAVGAAAVLLGVGACLLGHRAAG